MPVELSSSEDERLERDMAEFQRELRQARPAAVSSSGRRRRQRSSSPSSSDENDDDDGVGCEWRGDSLSVRAGMWYHSINRTYNSLLRTPPNLSGGWLHKWDTGCHCWGSPKQDFDNLQRFYVFVPGDYRSAAGTSSNVAVPILESSGGCLGGKAMLRTIHDRKFSSRPLTTEGNSTVLAAIGGHERRSLSYTTRLEKLSGFGWGISSDGVEAVVDVDTPHRGELPLMMGPVSSGAYLTVTEDRKVFLHDVATDVDVPVLVDHPGGRCFAVSADPSITSGGGSSWGNPITYCSTSRSETKVFERHIVITCSDSAATKVQMRALFHPRKVVSHLTYLPPSSPANGSSLSDVLAASFRSGEFFLVDRRVGTGEGLLSRGFF